MKRGSLHDGMSSEETWGRLLALNKAQLRDSIAACARYLRSPEGVAEFGSPRSIDEIAHARSQHDGEIVTGRAGRVEKLEKAR